MNNVFILENVLACLLYDATLGGEVVFSYGDLETRKV
jgi:hypothetical protein